MELLGMPVHLGHLVCTTWAAQCFPMGPGLQGLPEGRLLLPSPVRPVSGSPPLAGSALVGPPLALPSRGAGGPLCFVLLPLVSAAFWLFLFCVLVRDHSWMRGAIPRSDVGTHIGSRFSTLAKRTSGSLKGFVCEERKPTQDATSVNSA